jgi:TonB family protein
MRNIFDVKREIPLQNQSASMSRRVWLSFLLFSVVNPAFAANDSQPLAAEHFSANPTALYQTASTIPTPAGEDVVMIREEQSHVFEADGRCTSTYYIVYKVVTQKGAESWADASLPWEPWHEEPPTLKARVITPDREEHVLDAKTISDSAARETDSKTYSDRRILRAPLPAMTVGAVVEEEFIKKETAPLFGAGTVSKFYFGHTVPVTQARLLLDAPASLPLQYRLDLLPNLKPQRIEQNGRVQIVFEAGPLEALDAVPDYLPNNVPVYPGVTFSTGASWQAMAEAYSKIVDERITTTNVAPQVKHFLLGKTSRSEKITALVQGMNRQVRYTGIEFGEAAIIPHSPEETWSRKYGDCKDKSVLLVSLLRTAGIPAYVALLDAGFGQDVIPDLPGMGLFDHAIVYMPGDPDVWIDATDEYARPGQLPAADQGRLALIARNGERTLRPTPVNSSSDNLLLVNQEFFLADNGPARVVETSEPHGSLESSYRQSFTDENSKKSKEQLTDYMKSRYLAQTLDRFDRTDPADTAQQFQLVLESSNAKRGFTDLESAVVAIRLESLFDWLPPELQRRERTENHNNFSIEHEEMRSAGYQLHQGFVTEWHYTIVPPAGFRAKPLPKNQQLSLGPATFSEDFSVSADRLVHAAFRFDTAKRLFSISEATEMRNKIAELKDRQPVLIYFEPVAKALFREGKIKESFQAYEDLIAQHPTEAVHHLQLAKALLEEGMGQAARDETALATKLEPASPLVWKAMAEILEHDLVGRKFRPGSDYVGAEAALRAAIALDPKDKEIVGNLAILLEYNSQGERYGPGAKLKEATAAYLSLTPDNLADLGLKTNVVYALLYSGQFAEVLKYAGTLDPYPTEVTAAGITALDGVDAGLTEARKHTASDEEYKEVVKSAGAALMRMHQYATAADLLQAGASGDNASQTIALASMLRNARPRASLRFEDNAKGAVEKSFLLMLEPGVTLDSLRSMSSRNARVVLDDTDADEINQSLNAGREMRSMLMRSGLPADVMLDLMLPLLDPAAEGTDTTGYRVTLHMPGTKDMVLFVVREEGQYKILDSSDKPNAVGLEILDRLEAHDVVAARQMLDWVRELQHLAGGDDPFEGEAFPRFWTQGKEADAGRMKLAAASLLVQTKPTAKKGIAILEPARSTASTDVERLNIDLALMRGYLVTEDYTRALPIASGLVKQNPESRVLFLSYAFALQGLARWSELHDIAEERLSRKPHDLAAMRLLVASSEGRGDFRLARSLGRKIEASGKAEQSDLNNLAWDSLFSGSVDASDVEAAVKAAQTGQDSPNVLHTLGCVYAEVGKTQEAREVLLQGMDKLNLDAPDSDYWYAFGRIAEQYGQRDIAISLYSRVTEPKEPNLHPASSYRLAQIRMEYARSMPSHPVPLQLPQTGGASEAPDRASGATRRGTLNGSVPQSVRVAANVSEGWIIKKVEPVYPDLARQARVQGSVVLHAEINKDGTVDRLELISGHPMLVSAAINAVKQWIYKPYLFDGKAVNVDTDVVINFSLSP